MVEAKALNKKELQERNKKQAIQIEALGASNVPTYANARFYRNNYRRGMMFSLIMAAACILLLLVVAYQYVLREEPSFYLTTSDGKLIELIPTNPSKPIFPGMNQKHKNHSK